MTRGVHGSEKGASLAYLFERGVDFSLLFQPHREPLGQFWQVDLAGLRANIVCYRREVASALRARGVPIPSFEAFLDDYIAELEHKPRQAVQFDYSLFRLFYFAHNDDPGREQAFLQALR